MTVGRRCIARASAAVRPSLSMGSGATRRTESTPTIQPAGTVRRCGPVDLGHPGRLSHPRIRTGRCDVTVVGGRTRALS